MVLARATRVLLAALVFLAGMATPALVCADHEPAAVRPAHHDGHGAGNEHHDRGPAAPADPCDRPGLPPCCPVLMSCAVALFAGEGAGAFPDAGASRMPLLRLSRVLPSRITAPDPPPPRS